MANDETISLYIREQHTAAIEALRILSAMCEDNGIRFYLLAGSVLGAVRHKGFIPWDDDIDIGIFDEDYQLFREIALKTFSQYGFEFRDRFTDPALPRMFGKIIRSEGFGVIDCFRLIRVPDNELLQAIQWDTKRVLYGMWKRKVYPPVAQHFDLFHKVTWKLKSLLVLPVTVFFPKSLFEKQLSWIEKHPGKSTRYVSNFYSIYSREKELIPLAWLENPSIVSFEGDEYPAPSDLDGYLTKLYGDYMTPPGEVNRRPAHKWNVF